MSNLLERFRRLRMAQFGQTCVPSPSFMEVLSADSVRRWIERHDRVDSLVLYSDLKGARERSQPETAYCGQIQWVGDGYPTSFSGATYEEAVCEAGEVLMKRALGEEVDAT